MPEETARAPSCPAGSIASATEATKRIHLLARPEKAAHERHRVRRGVSALSPQAITLTLSGNSRRHRNGRHRGRADSPARQRNALLESPNTERPRSLSDL